MGIVVRDSLLGFGLGLLNQLHCLFAVSAFVRRCFLQFGLGLMHVA